jgi:alkanesulfonate monooxygenase SsuD/methylene tetrahydromethanopterin reductase-like flavin-dependent oxidoreductase (luciferase family)/predicted kinase
VVLVGASGSGKSTWAAQSYRATEVVSSDALRAVVGSGEADLDASREAFALLDQIVAARLRRGLTVVVDTLGLDPAARAALIAQGTAAGMPCVAVLFDTKPEVCRARNAQRDRPVPARALDQQLARAAAVEAELRSEPWAAVMVLDGGPSGDDETLADRVPRAAATPGSGSRDTAVDVVLHVSRFPWGQDPAGWLRSVAIAADEAGFAGISLMDHLIQIPQVDRAWEPIPEPWVALGMLAGLDTRLRLGTLVSPVTFRSAGVLAKTVATLDVLSNGRAFLGLGAGWWEREHLGFGLPFPPARERLDLVESAIETIRALWSAGTKGYDGERVHLPETTAYPRPVSAPPIILGGGGERRTLRIAARSADGCNLPSEPEALQHKVSVLHRHCEEVGRDPGEVAVTVLDLPVVGHDRDDTWRRVERLRGRTPAAAYARRHHAGEAAAHRARYEQLAALGVQTVFVALADLESADDIGRLAPVLEGL